MTLQRIWGEESAFSCWLRNQRELDSIQFSLCIHDADYTLHKFKVAVDGEGTREVHLMMEIQVKMHGGLPDRNQLQSLFFKHQLLCEAWKRRKLLDNRSLKRVSVRHFGVYVLSLPTEIPAADNNQWCQFSESGSLCPQAVNLDTLYKLIRMDIHPDTLEPIDFRRHHKTQRIVTTEVMPLGFAVQREIVVRS